MADYNSCSGALTLNTINAKCDKSVGGIKRILIGEFDKVSNVAMDSDAVITAVTRTQGSKFESWSFRPNTGSYTSTFESDPAIGNSTVTTEVALQFSRAEAQKRLNIQSALNGACIVVVEDMYGNYLYLGQMRPVYVTSATMVSGTNNNDLSGFTVTFQDINEEIPHYIEKTAAEGLLTAQA